MVCTALWPKVGYMQFFKFEYDFIIEYLKRAFFYNNYIFLTKLTVFESEICRI